MGFCLYRWWHSKMIAINKLKKRKKTRWKKDFVTNLNNVSWTNNVHANGWIMIDYLISSTM